MRIEPDPKYHGLPCSYVGVGCAYEDINHKDFNANLPDTLKNDGYLSLDNANKFIRQYLDVQRKEYLTRKERMTLSEFMETNKSKACICVLGHFIYVNGKNYWSYFDNDNDDVVCIWYLK